MSIQGGHFHNKKSRKKREGERKEKGRKKLNGKNEKKTQSTTTVFGSLMQPPIRVQKNCSHVQSTCFLFTFLWIWMDFVLKCLKKFHLDPGKCQWKVQLESVNTYGLIYIELPNSIFENVESFTFYKCAAQISPLCPLYNFLPNHSSLYGPCRNRSCVREEVQI